VNVSVNGVAAAETTVVVAETMPSPPRARLMRVAELALGLTANYVMVISFDYVLYPL